MRVHLGLLPALPAAQPSQAPPEKPLSAAKRNAQAKNPSIMPVSFQEVTSLVAPPSSPVNEMFCMWEPHVSYLPDPTKDGKQGVGITGHVFMFDTAAPSHVPG